MKKVFISFVAIAFLFSCSSTKITGAWKNPKQPAKTYSSIFVASLSSNSVARATVENDMASALEKQGIASYKSMDEFPPGVKKDSVTKEEILGRMRNKKADGILTISLIRKETESHYMPGGGIPYAPFPMYPYYSDFGGYYSHWYPYAYSPGYYEQDKAYYIETNLYDSATEQLVWSAQSRTYNPTDLKDFSKDFSKTIVAKLKEDGMLKSSANLSSKK
jgi:hypothetical protein